MRQVLAESPAADAYAAFTALDRVLHGIQQGWSAELIEPIRSS